MILAVVWLAVTQVPADSARRDSVPPAAATATIDDRRLSEALISRFPGLLVSPLPGAAGAGARLRMRGPQTIIDGRLPLVIVDGIRVDASESGIGFGGTVSGAPRLDDLAAADIERIEVIPGPAAAGRYGPDAANGVVLIDTRSGALGAGAPRWQLTMGGSGRHAYDYWPNNFAGIDTDSPIEQYRTGGCRLALEADGACSQDSIMQFRSALTRRQFQTGWRRNYGLRVWGGSRRLGYQVSGESEMDGGIVALAATEAGRLRVLGQAPGESVLHPDNDRRWTLRANVDARPRDDLEIRLRAARFEGAQRIAPIEQLLQASLRECCTTNRDSVVTSMARLFQNVNGQELGRWLTSLESQWRPSPSFSLRAVAGRDAVDQHGSQADPGSMYFGSSSHVAGTRTFGLTADYALAFSSSVRAHTTAGVERVLSESRRDGLERHTIPPFVATIESTVVERRRAASVFLYQSLDLSRAIQLSGGLRRDWLRAFGGWSPAVTHPSFSVAWMPGAGSGSGSLRFHAAYGSAGRQPIFRGMRAEETKEWTAGVQGTAFGGRANFGATFYDMRSDAYTDPIKSIYGAPASKLPDDFGVVSNRGVEVSLGGRLKAWPGITIDLGLSAWGNRNRLERMVNAPFVAGAYGSQSFRPGFPIGGYWVQPIRYYGDANGDGLISQAEVVLGNPVWAGTPYPTRGATFSFDVGVGHAIRLGGLLEYRGGNKIFNYAEFSRCVDRCRESIDATSAENAQANVVWSVAGPRFIERADFLKLRAVSLSVDAPSRVVALFAARAASISITGRNLLTMTSYKHGDPETQVREPTIGSPEVIAGWFLVPPLPEWSIQVRLTY